MLFSDLFPSVMGNDGGTKALSRKYSRWSTKKEVAHVESEEAIQGKWSMCALSGEALQEPVFFVVKPEV